MIAAAPTTNGDTTGKPGGFLQIENAIVPRLVRLSGLAVRVYIVLSMRSDCTTRICWPSLSRLVKDTAGGRGHVMKAIRELQAAGLLAVESHGGKHGRGGTSNQYRIRTSSEMELVPFGDGTGSQMERKLVPNGNPNKTHRTILSNKTHRRALRHDPADMETAVWMFSLVCHLDAKAKEPSLDAWANEIRLMRTADGRTDEDIRSVFQWANSDEFWKSNILSPSKLRQKFTTLLTQRSRNGSHTHNGKPQRHTDSGAHEPGRRIQPIT